MATIHGTHICHFMLEQNAKGYFTGNFICTYGGHKVAQSQWFDTLTAASSGLDSSYGLSRTPPGPNDRYIWIAAQLTRVIVPPCRASTSLRQGFSL